MTTITSGFDIEIIVDLLNKYRFQHIVLQFASKYLHKCVELHNSIKSQLTYSPVELYITADSTWGSSSIDDISAMHIKGDVIVYFGSDLSSSSSIPVIVAPESLPVDMDHCQEEVNKAIRQSIEKNTPESFELMIFYEASYHWAALKLSALLHTVHTTSNSIHSIPIHVHLAQLPETANLHNWAPTALTVTGLTKESIRVGGLLVPKSFALLTNAEDFSNSGPPPSTGKHILYLGTQSNTMENILFRYSSFPFFHYHPLTQQLHSFLGTEYLKLHERYGGIHRVKKANTIGLIVGSMSYHAQLTQNIVKRLETLIHAAKKASYTFVLGKLNEAKICNFPEVDCFVLIANEDNLTIPPKTYPVPVITPYELEIGLGAREWNSILLTNLEEQLEEDLEIAKERIREYFGVHEEEEGDGEEDTEHVRMHLEDFQSVAVNDQQVMVFESAANEYFQTRNFQGLTMDIPEHIGTTIQMGQEGIAASYHVVPTTKKNNQGSSGEGTTTSSSISSSHDQKVVDIEDILLQ